jgi:sensor histidine kinase regulating citrate/malate metabolism
MAEKAERQKVIDAKPTDDGMQLPKRKFFLLSFGILIIIYLMVTIFLGSFIQGFYLDQNTQLVSDFVKNQANKHLNRGDFTIEDNSQASKATFDSFFEETIGSDDVIRIKVWNKEGTIIYSDNPEIVGLSFADNKHFQEAIKGNVNSEIKDPIDPENVGETGYGQLMEIYVPVKFEGEADHIGVIEVYYSLDQLNEILKQLRLKLAIILLLSFSLIFVSLNFVLKHTHKDIDKQSRELVEDSKKLKNLGGN